MAGKLIAIEGGDGAGKATQTKMLVEYLSRKSDKVLLYSFPNYHHNFFGGMVKEYLMGNFGDFKAIHPKVAAMLYACDRWESLSDMQTLLYADYTLVCDRYVHSNVIYQCARLPEAEQDALRKHIEWMEFNVFKLPRPHRVIYLDMPPELSNKLVVGRGEGQDIYEAEAEYRKTVYEVGRRMSYLNNWGHVHCTYQGEIRTKEGIHKDIIDLLGVQ